MIHTIAVAGAGTMGGGIAQTFAQAGHDVLLYDESAAAIDRARRAVEKSLAKFVEKGEISDDDRDAALACLRPAATVGQLVTADFFIEAIPYKETREYVARVLAFSVVYDWRLNGRATSLADRLQGKPPAEAGQRRAFTCPVPSPPPPTSTNPTRTKPTR